MPPVSVLPYTSSGAAPKRRANSSAVAAGSGPPEEKMARAPGRSDSSSISSGRRVRCAGLDTTAAPRVLPSRSSSTFGSAHSTSSNGRPADSGQTSRNSMP